MRSAPRQRTAAFRMPSPPHRFCSGVASIGDWNRCPAPLRVSGVAIYCPGDVSHTACAPIMPSLLAGRGGAVDPLLPAFCVPGLRTCGPGHARRVRGGTRPEDCHLASLLNAALFRPLRSMRWCSAPFSFKTHSLLFRWTVRLLDFGLGLFSRYAATGLKPWAISFWFSVAVPAAARRSAMAAVAAGGGIQGIHGIYVAAFLGWHLAVGGNWVLRCMRAARTGFYLPSVLRCVMPTSTPTFWHLPTATLLHTHIYTPFTLQAL